jgi:predicted protein tyrosine phosphatase
MKFVVHSRHNMMAALPPEKPWAVISICEKGDFPEIHTNEFQQGRLNLQFHDADVPKDEEILFDESMARQVLDFYQAQEEAGTSVMYVHCLMGQARSAAVAAALTKALTGDDGMYFRPGPYKPNMLVFRKVLDECHERGMI